MFSLFHAHKTRKTRSSRIGNECFHYAVSGVSSGSLSPGSGSSVGIRMCSCSAIQSPSPIPTNGTKQVHVVNTCTQCTQTRGIPVSKSDLSAIMAGGKQVVSRVSRSIPELTMRKISEHAQPENSELAQYKIPGECHDGLPQTNEGSSCYPVLYGSPLHSPQSCTSAPSSSMSTVIDGHGRIPSGWQHSLC